MTKIKIPGIPEEAIIDIQVSGYFHQQLVTLLTGLCETRPSEDVREVMLRLKDDNPPQDVFELNLSVLLSLINDIEIKAKEQNKLVDREFEVEEPSGS